MSYYIYLICYFAIVMYFTVLGFYLVHRARHNEVEPADQWNIRWSAVVYMFAWVINMLVYLPAILLDGFDSTQTYYYNICFLINISISATVTVLVMHTLVRQDVVVRRWVPTILIVGMALTVAYVITREIGILIAGYIVVACIFVQLLLSYTIEYRRYIFRLKAEFSDLSGREIKWSWYAYFGFVLQIVFYMIYQVCFNIVLEYIYMGISVVNASLLVYCVLRQRPLGNAISYEHIQLIEREATGEEENPVTDELFEEIGQKLATRCEATQLYLRQGLTREVLCREIGVNRTYLSIYLRQQGTTYYQYINTLRIRYAVQLRQREPDITLSELATRSGFKTLPTFHKAWEEIYDTI